MPRGIAETIPNDGLTTKQRRNRPLLIVHTGTMKGKSEAFEAGVLPDVPPAPKTFCEPGMFAAPSSQSKLNSLRFCWVISTNFASIST